MAVSAVIRGAWNSTSLIASQMQRLGRFAVAKLPNLVTSAYHPHFGAAALGLTTYKTATLSVTALTSVPVVATGVALVSAGSVMGAAYMAYHSGQAVVLKVPNGPLLTLNTPGRVLPKEPEKIIPDLFAKVSQFKKDHPAGMFFEKPPPVPVVNPFEAPLREARTTTDQRADLLVKNSSIYATLSSIYLGEKTEEVGAIFMRIIQASAQPGNQKELWDLYTEHFPNLTFFQKIQGRFWYFIYYTIGVLPNSIRAFKDNFVNAFRKSFEEGRTEKLDTAVEKILKLGSSFFGILNNASEDFAKGNPPHFGKLSDYQEHAIEQLGDEDILAKVKAGLKPGENLKEKVMEELCRQFTHTLLDEFFPRVPFFESLKAYRICGLRVGVIFDLLDWAFGGMINVVMRSLIKKYLPKKVNQLIRLGIEKTLPGQRPFKIALANTLTNQIEELKRVLARNNKPIRLMKNDHLSGLIDKLLKALDLKKLGDDPLPEALELKLQQLKKKEDHELRERMRDVMIEGGQHLIEHYTENPVNIEQVFADFFDLSNKPFQPGAEVQNEEAYLAAKGRLKNAGHSLVSEQIRYTVLRREIQGPDPIKFREDLIDGIRDPNGNLIHPGLFSMQKQNALRSLNALRVVAGQALMTLKDLDQCAEILNDFARDAENLNVDLYSPAVQDAFYASFAPIYQDVLLLMDQIIAPRANQIARGVFVDTVDRLRIRLNLLQPPVVHFPQQHVPEPILQTVIKWVGEPNIRKVQEYFDSGYDLITSNKIYEASARLAMGELIRTYRKD